LTISSHIGFSAGSNLTSSTTTKAYGFYGDLGVDGDKNYNIYAKGTAPNYFQGLTEHASGVKVSGGNSNVSNLSEHNSRVKLTPLGEASGIAIDNSNGNILCGNTNAFIAPNATVNVSLDSGNTRGVYAFGACATGNLTDDVIGFRNQITPKTDGTQIGNNFYAYEAAYSPSTWTNDADKIAGDVVAFHAGNNDFAPCTGSAIAFKASNNNLNGAFNFYASNNAPSYFAGQILLPGASSSVIINNDPINGSSNDPFALDSGVELKVGMLKISNKTGTSLQLKRETDGVLAMFYQGAKSVNNQKGSISVDAAGVSFNETSDYRLKSNIVDLSAASEVVKTLQPRTYSIGGLNNVSGFIAHELQAVVPRAVTGTKDATEAIGTLTDYDGSVLETAVTEPDNLTYTEEVEVTPYVAAVAATYDEYGEELTAEVPEVEATYTTVTRTRTWTPTGTQPIYQGVDQGKLIPLLTKALQEVLTKNEDLEARIAALEGA